jgi:hypothetical protein
VNILTTDTTFHAPAIEEYLDALGYPVERDVRYVASFFGWGDEANYSDGQIAATGEWTAWLLYVDHPRVLPWLGSHRYHLGSSDDEATHYLVVDRQRGEGVVMTVRAARLLLRSQWPSLVGDQTVMLTAADLKEIERTMAAAFAKREPITDIHAEVMARMADQQRKLETLAVALVTVGAEKN